MVQTVQLSEVAFDEHTPLPAEGEDVVVRWGKIFACGDYPDKDFSIDPQELHEAVSAFAPVPVDLAHVPDDDNVLAGKLGSLTAVKIAEDGTTLLGGVAFPRWLDNILLPSERKVSTTWGRTPKRIAKLALTTRPRVPDAVLMSAYAEFAGRRHSQTDQQMIQDAHDTLAKVGALCDRRNVHYSDTEETPPMDNNANPDSKPAERGIFARLAAAFSQAASDEAPAEQPAPLVAPAPAPAPAPSAPELAEFAALKAENERLRKEGREKAAANFVDGLITTNRLFPSGRKQGIATFTRLAEVAAAQPATVTFSDAAGNEVSADLVESIQALFSHVPTHSLTKEAAITHVLPGAIEAPKEDSTARIDALLGMTGLGKEVKARKNGK
jgi:hypothetical protein